MKDTILIVILLLVIFGLSNSSQEVRDRAFVQSIAVQTDENHVYTSVSVYGDDYSYKGIGSDFKTSLSSAETRQGNSFFTGHIGLVAFHDGCFSKEILISMLKDYDISPNCAVIIYNSNVEDTQMAYDILKTYDRLNEVHIKTASNIIKELQTNNRVEIPLLNKDYIYTTIEVSS